MKSFVSIAAIAIFIGSPLVAGPMVVGTGDMSLTEAAQVKFNRDTRPDDRYVVPAPGSSVASPQLYAAAGVTPEAAQGWTIDQLHVAKINREGGSDSVQIAPGSISRGYGQRESDYSHLGRSFGLDPDEIAGMSLWDVATAKLNSEH